jgi:hypothetical protein
MKSVLKILLSVAAGAGAWWIGKFIKLNVSPLWPGMLTLWGSICFLFSFELAGSRTRIRNGVEEKTVLHLFWILAGVICLFMAGFSLFYWM